jgi:nucleoid DNA-binding protein
MRRETCNKNLYDITAIQTKNSPKQVEEVIDFLSKFTKGVITKGVFETVMIPNFGKIKVKTKRAQWSIHREVMPTIPSQKINTNETI